MYYRILLWLQWKWEEHHNLHRLSSWCPWKSNTMLSLCGLCSLIVWFIFWAYRWSLRSSFETWRPERMPSFVLMFWPPCYHIPWTLRMASFLQKGVLLSNDTVGTLLFPVVSLLWVSARFHPIQRLCYTVLCRLPVVVRCHPVVYEKD